MEIEADSIRNSIFYIDSMTGVGFLNFKGKSITNDDLFRRSSDVAYFTFRFNINPHLLDLRASGAIHFVSTYSTSDLKLKLILGLIQP